MPTNSLRLYVGTFLLRFRIRPLRRLSRLLRIENLCSLGFAVTSKSTFVEMLKLDCVGQLIWQIRLLEGIFRRAACGEAMQRSPGDSATLPDHDIRQITATHHSVELGAADL